MLLNLVVWAQILPVLIGNIRLNRKINVLPLHRDCFHFLGEKMKATSEEAEPLPVNEKKR